MGIQSNFNLPYKGEIFNEAVSKFTHREFYDEVLETRKRTSVSIGELLNNGVLAQKNSLYSGEATRIDNTTYENYELDIDIESIFNNDDVGSFDIQLLINFNETNSYVNPKILINAVEYTIKNKTGNNLNVNEIDIGNTYLIKLDIDNTSSKIVMIEKKQITFDTIADLQQSTHLNEGDLVEVSGYNNKNENHNINLEISLTQNPGGVLLANSLFANQLPMPNGQYNVKHFGAKGDGVTDDQLAFQNAFGGEGTTPDNRYVFAPSGNYILDNPLNSGLIALKIYRSGETLKNVGLIGESPESTTFTWTTNSRKGIVFGEPDTNDGLWGSASDINVEGVYIKNFSHDFNDIGLWTVYCKNVLVENVNGKGLTVFASGNDAWDDCENVDILNCKRTGDGSDLSPDSWYSIGLYRTNNFTIHNFKTSYLSAFRGTGGVAITINESENGDVISCQVKQEVTTGENARTGQGIIVSQSSKDIRVKNNYVEGCFQGLVNFTTTLENIVFQGNTVKDCEIGINALGRNTDWIGNTVIDSNLDGLQMLNSDASNNNFRNNNIDSYNILPAIQQINSFLNEKNMWKEMYIPAIEFVQYAPTNFTKFEISSLRAQTDSSISRLAKHISVPCDGYVRNVVYHYERKTAGTISNYIALVNRLISVPVNQGENIDSTSSVGLVQSIVTLYSGTEIAVTVDTPMLGIWICESEVAELIGISFEFKPVTDHIINN